MGIFWCISITNNVNSCKKFNEKAQMTNFGVLAKGRRPCQEIFAKKHGKLGKLKRKLLILLKGMTYLGWYHGKGHVQSIPKMW